MVRHSGLLEHDRLTLKAEMTEDRSCPKPKEGSIGLAGAFIDHCDDGLSISILLMNAVGASRSNSGADGIAKIRLDYKDDNRTDSVNPSGGMRARGARMEHRRISESWQ